MSPLLSFCSVEGICDYLSTPIGSFIFSANGTGCSSQQEIENNCSSCIVDNIWIGPLGRSWHNQNYWSLSIIPNDCHHVVIPEGSDLKVMSWMTAYAFTLFIHDSAIFKTEVNAILEILAE